MLDRFRQYNFRTIVQNDDGNPSNLDGYLPSWASSKTKVDHQPDRSELCETSLELDNSGSDLALLGPRRTRSSALADPDAPWWDVSSFQFNVFSAAITVAYAILVGVETDYGVSQFKSLESVFAILLGMELLLRGYQLRGDLFDDHWNLWDCILFASAILDLYVAPMISEAFLKTHYHDILERLRLLRTLRIVRLFRHFHDLVNIFAAFKEALSVVLWLTLLILIINYICAIFLTHMLGRNAHLWGESEQDITKWFGTIADSMQTLFVVQTLSDWNKIADVVMEVAPRLPVMLFFVSYILTASYTMVSLITGVISESLLMTQQDDHQRRVKELEEDKAKFYQDLKALLASFDIDESGKLTPDEIKEALVSNPNFLTRLHALEIHVDLHTILEIVNRCETKDGVPIERLADTLTTLTGVAKSTALINFRNYIEDELGHLKRNLRDLKMQMRCIADHLNCDRTF